VLTLFLAATVFAAKPTFQDVLKKFPVSTLPITIKDATDQKTQLTRADVDALGFLKDKSEGLRVLREWKDKPYADEQYQEGKKYLWPVALIERSGYQLLLIQYDSVGQMLIFRETFLLSYNSKGELLGGVAFHEWHGGEMGEERDLSTLDQAGVISRLIKVTMPMMEEGLPPDLVITSEQRAKVTSTGAIEVMAPAWSSRTGTFIDRKSKEELRVFTKRVFYRANETKPFQELEGDGNNMHFKDSPKPYVLTWDDRRSAISCQNPDGSVQLFTREW
jgi:hypothetical protein